MTTAARRPARISSWLAIALAAVVLLLAAAMIPLALLTHWESGWSSAEQIAQYLPLAAVGFKVAPLEVIFPLFAVFWLVLIIRLLLTARRAAGERRQQLKCC